MIPRPRDAALAGLGRFEEAEREGTIEITTFHPNR